MSIGPGAAGTSPVRYASASPPAGAPAAAAAAAPASPSATLLTAQSILESLGGSAPASSPSALPLPAVASAAEAAPAAQGSPILDPPSLEELAQWLSHDGAASADATATAETNVPSVAAALAAAATPLPAATGYAAASPGEAASRSPSRGLLPDGVDRDLLESLIRGATPAVDGAANMSTIKGVSEMEAEWNAAERLRQRKQLEHLAELSSRGRIPAEAVTEAQQLQRGVDTLLHDLDISTVPAEIAAQVGDFAAASAASVDAQLSAQQIEALETAYMLASNGANAEMLSAALANQLLPCFLESQTGLPLSFSEFIKLVRMSKHALRTGVGIAIDYNRLRREIESQSGEISRLSQRRTELQRSMAYGGDDAAAAAAATQRSSATSSAASRETATIMMGQPSGGNATVSSVDADAQRQAVVVRLQLQVYSLRSEISEYQRKLRAAMLTGGGGGGGGGAGGAAGAAGEGSSDTGERSADGGDGTAPKAEKQSGIAQYLTKKNAQLESDLAEAKLANASATSEVRVPPVSFFVLSTSTPPRLFALPHLPPPPHPRLPRRRWSTCKSSSARSAATSKSFTSRSLSSPTSSRVSPRRRRGQTARRKSPRSSARASRRMSARSCARRSKSSCATSWRMSSPACRRSSPHCATSCRRRSRRASPPRRAPSPHRRRSTERGLARRDRASTSRSRRRSLPKSAYTLRVWLRTVCTRTVRGANMLGGASQIVSKIRVKCNGT